MKTITLNQEQLASLLDAAGAAHHAMIGQMITDGEPQAKIEAENTNWAPWYAEYIFLASSLVPGRADQSTVDAKVSERAELLKVDLSNFNHGGSL